MWFISLPYKSKKILLDTFVHPSHEKTELVRLSMIELDFRAIGSKTFKAGKRESNGDGHKRIALNWQFWFD